MLFGCLFSCVVVSAQNQHAGPLNSQLASPEIERKVDALLQRMTIKEKIGQLVQYSATEAHPSAPTTKTTTALNVNPPGPGGVDSYELARKAS
jgi:beta-glucosidase